MESLLYLLLETIIVGFMVIIFHNSIRNFGLGPLFILMGSIQFFQTILASSVYNLYFDRFVFSPGSSVLFTSTIYCIFLVFHTESIKKVRSLIYGLLFANIAITLLSYISLQQVYLDSQSFNVEFLKNIFNFDINMFLIGTSLLYLDAILLIVLYELMNYFFKDKFLFLKIIVPSSIICFFDSIVFYSFNFLSSDNYIDLMFGNIVGKQITVLFFSVFIYTYLTLIGKKSKPLKPKKLRDVLKIFSF